MIDMDGDTPLDSGPGTLPDPALSVTAVVDARGVVAG